MLPQIVVRLVAEIPKLGFRLRAQNGLALKPSGCTTS
jgi:hypothetical protein